MKVGDNIFAVAWDEGKKQIEQNWQIVSKGERFSYEYQYDIYNRYFQYYEIFVNPIYGPKEEIIGISYLCRNVTESKKTTEQLHTMQMEILNTKLKEQFIQTNSILEGQELERKRLGREMHDGLGQMLNVLKMQLNGYSSSMEAKQTLNHIMAEVKRIYNNLMPLILQDFGLDAGVKQLIEQYKKITNAEFYYFSDIKHDRFDSKLEVGIYRIVQEAVSNAVKYADASNISIQITKQLDSLLIMVEDDGIGFDINTQKHQKGFGLLNMQFRAEALEGKIDIESQIGHGCLINVEFKL